MTSSISAPRRRTDQEWRPVSLLHAVLDESIRKSANQARLAGTAVAEAKKHVRRIRVPAVVDLLGHEGLSSGRCSWASRCLQDVDGWVGWLGAPDGQRYADGDGSERSGNVRCTTLVTNTSTTVRSSRLSAEEYAHLDSESAVRMFEV